MRILVVEDELKVAALIRAGLEAQGFAVELCHRGDEAWTRMESEPFDAVVLDVMLPGRDGLSLLRKLRAGHNPMPVILLTARGDTDERIEGLNLGADDYLAKPGPPFRPSPISPSTLARVRSGAAGCSLTSPSASSPCSNVSCARPAGP